MLLPRLVLLLGLAATPATLPAQGSISLSVPLKDLIKTAAADSNDPAAHYNLALGYWGAKRWADVESELKTTLQLDPRFAEAHLARAYLQKAANLNVWEAADPTTQKGYDEQVATFNREYRHAFLINPKVDIRIIASVSRKDNEDLLMYYYGSLVTDFLGGMAACTEGRYANCELRLTNVIRAIRNSDAPDDAYWFRGLAAAQNGSYGTAADDFKLLLERTTSQVKKAEEKTIVNVPIRSNEYRYFRAVFLHLKGDTLLAEGLYREVLQNDLGMYIAHVRLAEIYESRRDYPHAIEERRRAINANPDDPSLQLDLGVTLGKGGKMAEAETALTAATQAMPRNIEAWFWLGLASEQTGKKAEAKAAYEKVIALAPTRFKARADQAQARLAKLQ